MGTDEKPKRENFKELSTKELRTINFRSESIKSIAAIMIIHTIASLYAVDLIKKYGGEDIISYATNRPFYAFRILLVGFAFIGLVLRTEWGRITAILDCLVWLVGFPLLTIVSIWGLFVLIPGRNLFGPTRLFAKDVKAELKWRKLNQIA